MNSSGKVTRSNFIAWGIKNDAWLNILMGYQPSPLDV
jgi:hypothetical protein